MFKYLYLIHFAKQKITNLHLSIIVGDCNKEEPGSWDLAGKMKWNSWIGKKGMSQDDAKAEYVKVADKIFQLYRTSS